MIKKILVVDDDEGILDAISLILEDAGYTVDTVFKGDETYEKVRKFKPDVVLLDILLSGKDGREICKELKKNPDTHHIPVIMISAHPNAEKSVKSYGADDFLAKPFDTDELLDLVSKYMRK